MSRDGSSSDSFSSRSLFSTASSQSSIQSQRPVGTVTSVKVLRTCHRYWKIQDSARPEAFISLQNNSCLRIPNAALIGQSQSDLGLFGGLNSCLADLHAAVEHYGNVNIAKLDNIIALYFKQIGFEDWVEASVGSRSDAVDSLLMAVALLRLRISSDFKADAAKLPGGRPRRFLHPLTQWAIAECSNSELPIETLNFILDPIRRIIASSDRQHAFVRLMVLSARFEDLYSRPGTQNWSESMAEEFSFCDSLVSETPEALARALTEADVDIFDQTDIVDLCSDSMNACDRRWYWLSRQAYECAVVSSALTESIYRLANRLCDICNYHSMTALIAGVKEAISSPPRCQNQHYIEGYYRFLEPHNNFEYSRRRSIDHEALPWLAPFRAHFRAAQLDNRRPEVVSSSANLLLQIMAYSNRVHRTSSAFRRRDCVVLLGDTGVGKSCWLGRLRLREFLEDDEPTIEDSHTIPGSSTTKQSFPTEMLDCGGVNTLPALVPRWVVVGSAYILAYSVTSQASFRRIRVLYDMICRARPKDLPPPILLLGCKSDLVAERTVETEEGESMARQNNWLFAETSARQAHVSRSKDMLEILLRQVNRRRASQRLCISRDPPL